MKYTRPLSLFEDLLKTNATKPVRLLGLDIGTKYLGLAVSDQHNRITSPLSILLRKKTNIELIASDLQSLASELSIEGFVVGYPFDRQRKSARDAMHVNNLMEDLRKTGKLEGIKYTYWDECFSSHNVELLSRPLNLHPVDAKSIVDKFSAVVILQEYLDSMNRKLKLETAKLGDSSESKYHLKM